jgi:hypothetical protein
MIRTTLPEPLSTPRRHLSVVFLVINVFVPILIGAGIYTLWRSKTLLVFKWYRWVAIDTPMLSLRSYVSPARHLLPAAVIYSLPDALWVYSFTTLLQYVWAGHSRCPERTFWSCLPVALAVGSEIGQHFGLVPGTFDPVDLVAYFVAWATASVVVSAFIVKGE